MKVSKRNYKIAITGDITNANWKSDQIFQLKKITQLTLSLFSQRENISYLWENILPRFLSPLLKFKIYHF